MSIWEDDMGDMDLKLIEGERVSNKDSLILIFEVVGSAAPAGPTPVIQKSCHTKRAHRFGEITDLHYASSAGRRFRVKAQRNVLKYKMHMDTREGQKHFASGFVSFFEHWLHKVWLSDGSADYVGSDLACGFKLPPGNDVETVT
ncbi:hypothetical protein K435DRAFT_809184 [Dendrothele bispora CBS 962.96]|uniref:Uncharacterized protein n=1 Tax=Dendrothele bispora (strain CBS 962.96) TaxID=1314807 RepID=A0A4S8KZF0_DENBC|nr:hypothetical protein K435DRAFT_809184 [Dendrothele bispora CBS 962.96]